MFRTRSKVSRLFADVRKAGFFRDACVECMRNKFVNGNRKAWGENEKVLFDGRRCVPLMNMLRLYGPTIGKVILIAAIATALGGATGLAADDDEPQPALKVAIKVVEPFVFRESEAGSPTGFSIELWEQIANNLGRDFEYMWVETVGEMLEAVEQGDADVGVGALTITAEREERVDFTHSFFRSGLRIATARDTGPSLAGTLERFWSYDLFVATVAMVLLTFVTSNLLWFAERSWNSEAFPKHYGRGVWEASWWSLSTLITGGCENKAPETVLGRIVSIVWMLGGIVLVATFTATLASRMTAETVSAAVSGPEDLPGRRVATLAGTSVEENMRERLARVVACESLAEAIDATVAGEADVVVYDAPVLSHLIESTPDCPVIVAGPLFDHQDYGLAVPAGSMLREEINQSLLELGEQGTLASLNQLWFGERE